MQYIQIFPGGDWKVAQRQHLAEVFKGNDSVYVFSQTAFEFLLSEIPDINDHGAKHPDKGLTQYLIPKRKTRRGSMEAIFCPFSSPGRFFQGVQTLLVESQAQDYPCTLVLGVPAELFLQLLALKDQAPETDVPPDTRQPEALLLTTQQAEWMAVIRRKFHGAGPDAEQVRRQVLEAVSSKLPVLILGETGTGKEVAARLIHNLCPGRQRFIAVNCGAIPHELFESELFGHMAHAFTGAGRRDKEGLWELANGGTLFLDEIGDLPLAAQVKILRALESGLIRRIGGKQDIKVNARVIAATHRDLFRMVEVGAFREDLFYRLRLFVIRTPAMIENGEQFRQVIQKFWQDVTEDQGPPLDRRVLALLEKRSWVGNYRDLKNFLRALWDHLQCFEEREALPLHVKAIEERYGPSPKAPSDPAAGALDLEVRRMRYMQHHAMCAESLRALQLVLELLTRRGRTTPDDLELRLRHGARELALFLDKPHRFYDAQTFSAIDTARTAIESLLDTLPKGDAKTRAQAKRATLPKVNEALEATFRGTC